MSVDLPLSALSPSGEASEEASLFALFGEHPGAFGRLLHEHCLRSAQPLSIKEAPSGRYVWVNAPMAALLGRPAAQVIGRTDDELTNSAQAGLLRAADHAALASPGPTVTDHRLELPSGRRALSAMRLAVRAAGDVAPRLLATLWTDLGAQRQREAQLAAALTQIEQQQGELEALRHELDDSQVRDTTTGMHRGTLFDDMLRRELDLSSREHREFALVLVSLDSVPDEAALGVRLLAALGGQLRRNTRAMDSSCQLTTARFALVLSGVGLATAHARMESLRRQCAAHIVVADGQEHRYSVSMGIASYPHTAESLAALGEAAERAMSEAVRRGGNHVALASIKFDSGAMPLSS